MILTVSKEELQKRLSLIQNIAEKNSTMPILSHFLLAVTTTGATICATDLTVSIREPLQTVALSEVGSVCIPAKKLFEIVKESEGGISLKTDKDWLHIATGKSKFKLACLSTKDFPAFPSVKEDGGITCTGKDLDELIGKTIYAAGENEVRYTLNSLLFHIKPNDRSITVVATDGHRLAVTTKNVTVEGEEKKLIVPKKAAAELRKFLTADMIVKCSFSNNHIFFKAGEVEYVARLIEGVYPDYNQVMPQNNQKPVVVGAEAFTKGLRKAAILSKDGKNTVILAVDKGNMIISSSKDELGEASDELEVECPQENPFTVIFNSRYLQDAVGNFDSEKVTLNFGEALSPMLISSNGSREHLCVVMPVRV